jgi:autophagy-related protein 16
MASLESQISSLRDELATVYKTQGQNAQRLLSMNETLREKEEASRIDSENLRKTREEVANLRKRVDQHNELMAEKDRTAQASSGPFRRIAYIMTEPNHDRFCMMRLTHSN